VALSGHRQRNVPFPRPFPANVCFSWIFLGLGTNDSACLSNRIAGVRIAETPAAPTARAAGRAGGNGMAVPSGSLSSSVRPTGTIFELEALEGLPCGCVAAAYRARPWDVAVVSLEAKGPHCILAGHTSGQILRLGDPSEFDEEEADEYGEPHRAQPAAAHRS